ncbi:MAG: hypothetical protein WCW52_08965 [Elusimicrobiales bacterium]|jgi:hypothetical protein
MILPVLFPRRPKSGTDRAAAPPWAPVLLCLLLGGCFLNKKPEVALTEEPSIERALDMLADTPEGGPLTRFLLKNPVKFEYSGAPGACHRFSLDTGVIYLPKDYRNSDPLLTLALARAAYIYRLYTLSGLDEVLSEEEELGALFQARVGLGIGLANGDFERNRFAVELRSDFCTYIMDGSGAAAMAARAAALSAQPECQRPRDTLREQQVWLENMRKAIADKSFFQLLYDRDLRKVHKGVMSAGEAMKNDAQVRAMPTDELNRYQRIFYDKQNGIVARIEQLYREALKNDAAWRLANQRAIDQAREEFSACNMSD